MTKINENGQVEWTFDELDLVGAKDEISKEIDFLFSVHQYLCGRLTNFPYDSVEYDILYKESDLVYSRLSLLFKIRKNLYKLLEVK